MTKRLYAPLLLAGILVISVAASASRDHGPGYGGESKDHKKVRIDRGKNRTYTTPEPAGLLAVGSSALLAFEVIRRRWLARAA